MEVRGCDSHGRATVCARGAIAALVWPRYRGPTIGTRNRVLIPAEYAGLDIEDREDSSNISR